MITKKFLRSQAILIFLCGIIVSVSFLSCVGSEMDKTVLKAYDLRMNGKADEAKTLLEQLIAEDSTNAGAYYELARTKHHIGLGNPRQLFAVLEDMQQTIENAVENDPDNAIYAFYKGYICFTRAYVSSMRNQPDARKKVEETISAYESVLRLKPNYHEAKLFLVELLALLPSDMGGDSDEAEKYVRELEKADFEFGAKAREILMPEEANHVVFWKNIKKDQMNNDVILEALGRAYLNTNNVEEAIKSFEKAKDLNPKKNILYVDLGRYYMMQAMQNPGKLNSVFPMIENSFESYLNSQPEPINPLKAFVLGQLAKIKFRMDDKESGNKYHEKATALDPNYSKAFGTPSQILFDPPYDISRVHGYFFRPF